MTTAPDQEEIIPKPQKEENQEVIPKHPNTGKKYINQKRYPKEQKVKILTELAKGNKSIKEIAKDNNVNQYTIQNIKNKNNLEYQRILEEINRSLRYKSISIANKALDYVTDKKLNSSNAMTLMNIAKTGNEITYRPQQQINIDINIPESREDMLKFIINGNDEDNISNNVDNNDIIVDNIASNTD